MAKTQAQESAYWSVGEPYTKLAADALEVFVQIRVRQLLNEKLLPAKFSCGAISFKNLPSGTSVVRAIRPLIGLPGHHQHGGRKDERHGCSLRLLCSGACQDDAPLGGCQRKFASTACPSLLPVMLRGVEATLLPARTAAAKLFRSEKMNYQAVLEAKVDELRAEATTQSRLHGETVSKLEKAEGRIRELEAALRDMVATHGMHGPCRHHSCLDCKAAYGKAQQLLHKLPPKE